MKTIVGEIPTGVEMAASPKHLQSCVECGGWGGGLGNEPGTYARLTAWSLGLSPSGMLHNKEPACAPVCCVRKQDNENM